jgi:hypothetical protein
MISKETAVQLTNEYEKSLAAATSYVSNQIKVHASMGMEVALIVYDSCNCNVARFEREIVEDLVLNDFTVDFARSEGVTIMEISWK